MRWLDFSSDVFAWKKNTTMNSQKYSVGFWEKIISPELMQKCENQNFLIFNVEELAVK